MAPEDTHMGHAGCCCQFYAQREKNPPRYCGYLCELGLLLRLKQGTGTHGSGRSRAPRQQGQQREPAAAGSPHPRAQPHIPGSPQLRSHPSAAAPHLPRLSQPSTQPRRAPARRSAVLQPLHSEALRPWISRPSSPFPCAQQPEASCLPSSVSRQCHNQIHRQTCIQMSISVARKTRSLAPSPKFPNARISASPYASSLAAQEPCSAYHPQPIIQHNTQAVKQPQSCTAPCAGSPRASTLAPAAQHPSPGHTPSAAGTELLPQALGFVVASALRGSGNCDWRWL